MPFSNLNEWKPNKPQAQLLSVPFSIREAGLLTGAGVGKSELLLMFPLVHGFHLNSKFKQVFLRRTTKQLKKEIVPRSYEIYPKFGATFNESDMVWTFPRDDQFGSGAKNSGARIYLGHCENESDVHNYDSMEINLFTPDEITSLTYAIYSYIGFTRVRSNDPNLPAIIRFAGMPGDVGHSWVKQRFIDPAPSRGKKIIGKSGNTRICFGGSALDNPDCDPNYVKMLESLPVAEYKAKMGDWEAYLGQVFEEFRDIHYEDEPENALHVIDSFDIPSWWPKICAIDWGYNAMCSVGWGAISPNRKLYVYRHQYWYGKKIEEWAPEVKYFVDRDKPVDIIICHSANQHRGDPHTILEQVSEAIGQSIRLGEKNRLAGKTLLHEYLRWKQKEFLDNKLVGEFDNNTAQWILRNKGEVEYKLYLSLFNRTRVQEDIPRIQFLNLPDVKLIWEAVKACSYEKEAKDGKKKEDVAEFNGDDPYDMLRMLLHSADNFFGDSIAAQENLDKKAEIIEMMNYNPTGFYMRMRKLESEEGDQYRPIKRFHSGVRH